LIPEDPNNPEYILSAGEGLIVYALTEKDVVFNSVYCSEQDLYQGFNLIGFACPPDEYTVFQLLNDLGSENITTIQRYNAETGIFETAGFGENNQTVGIDFSIVPGEGYLVYMKQAVENFEP
jgi:hypothetical protein